MNRLLPAALLLAACTGDDEMVWEPVVEADDRGAYLMAWAAAPGDVWVVGGQPESGVVLRGDRDALEEVPLPEGTPLLNWVHGTGPDDVWVAGLSGTLLHWDGTDWTDRSRSTEAAFWGLHATGPDRALAVGGTSAWGGELAEAWSWDGTDWTALDLPPELADLGNLFKVHHDGEAWWACGFRGAVVRSPDGTDLTAIPTGYPADIVTLHGQPGMDPIMVGGRGTGAILEADGTSVSVTTQAPAGLSGVHVVDGTTAVVVGERGFAGLYDPSTDTLEPFLVDTEDVLHGVVVDGDTAWAAGGNLYTSGDRFLGSLWVATLPDRKE